MDSVSTKQTFLSGAKTFLGSLFFNLKDWCCQHTFGIGIFAMLAGINGHYTYMLDTQLQINSIIPFLSEISVTLGAILSGLGIVAKIIELRKNYQKKRRKKTK